MEWEPKEGRVVLHFDFFNAGDGPRFYFVEGERKEKGGGVGFHLGRSEVGWGLGETNWQGGGNEEEKKNREGDEQRKATRWEKRRRTGGTGVR